MPYKDIKELEKSIPAVKALPTKGKQIFLATFNSASQENDDTSAIKIAWSAVKKVYKKENGKWIKKATRMAVETEFTYPKLVQALPDKAKQIWINVYWNEKERNEVAGVKVVEAIESSANMSAWTAVKQTWRKNEHGVWVEKYNAKTKIETKPIDHGDYWSCGRLPIINEGIHNGEPYSVDELRELASNAIESTPMGIGHGIDWTLSLEGLAHAGLIEKMYVEGDTLFADVNYIPKPIGDMIFKKIKYPHRSIVEGKIEAIDDTNRIVRVDWLGVEAPAVKNLGAIQEIYDLKSKKSGGKSMDKKETPTTYEEGREKIQELSEDSLAEEETQAEELPLDERVTVLEERVTKLEEALAADVASEGEGEDGTVPMTEKSTDAEITKEVVALAEETIAEMELPKETLHDLQKIPIRMRVKAAKAIKKALKRIAPRAPLAKIKLSANAGKVSEFDKQLAEAKAAQLKEEV